MAPGAYVLIILVWIKHAHKMSISCLIFVRSLITRHHVNYCYFWTPIQAIINQPRHWCWRKNSIHHTVRDFLLHLDGIRSEERGSHITDVCTHRLGTSTWEKHRRLHWWHIVLEPQLCLSLYSACSKFRHYIISSSFIVACQYNVIKHMLLKPILSGRIGKWAYALVEYDLAYEPLRSMNG
jgi:hypothetical protein